MRRYILFPVAAVAVIVSLPACGGSGGASTGTPPQVLLGGSIQGVPVPLSDNLSRITVSTLAGDNVTLQPGYADGTGAGAGFNFPKGIATDGANLFVADSQNHLIRKVGIATGVVTTVAGDNVSASQVPNPFPDGRYADGTGASARFAYPAGVTTDGKGNLFVADTNNHLIRKVGISTGLVTTIAGDNAGLQPGYADATGTAARFRYPNGITTDGTNLYVADGDNHLIRKVVIATGVVTTIAGDNVSASGNPADPNVTCGYADGTGTSARFCYPTGITTDGTNLYVADTDNHLIRKVVIATGAVSTVAGDNANIPPLGSEPPYSDGTGNSATFASPADVTTDGTYLYVSDAQNNLIRKVVIATRVVTTIAGDNVTLQPGYADGTGATALLENPHGITTDGKSVFFSDMRNNTVRRIR